MFIHDRENAGYTELLTIYMEKFFKFLMYHSLLLSLASSFILFFERLHFRIMPHIEIQ